MENNEDNKAKGGELALKRVVIVLLLLLILLLILNGVLIKIFGIPEKRDEIGPTPTILNVTEVPPSPTALVIVSPTLSANTIKYVLADCEIEFLADLGWNATVRGRYGACVTIVKDTPPVLLEDFVKGKETWVSVVPFGKSSDFIKTESQDFESYLDDIETERNKFDPNKEFLYSRQEISLGGRSAIKAEIYSPHLGETRQIFYKGFTGEYVILAGGLDSQESEDAYAKVISSVEYLASVSEEE